MKRIGPNTEPWGIPVASRVGDDLQPEHKTVKVLSDRYEENQERLKTYPIELIRRLIVFQKRLTFIYMYPY